MAFDDLPAVAPSHIQSTRSVNRLRNALRPEEYILREDKPDYGTDFQAEPIIGARASNWRFHIQLKSKRQVALVESGVYATVEMKTSRLNYLPAQVRVQGLTAGAVKG